MLFLPNAQVENLKALLQQDYGQFEEKSEDGEMKEKTKVKTLKENRITWVSGTKFLFHSLNQSVKSI